ncbi:MAG: putative chemotaxis MotD protein [Proteobacteria bacterium]|nr:putative chemotaxis MotD protein [Pseudomonadota bacterium]
MTRIETPLASPTPDKPADKPVGRAASKDGDSRQAAFRSLMRQLGHDGAANGTTGKETKALPGDAKHRLPGGSRRGGPDDGAPTGAPEADAAAQPGEPAASGEPVLTWQAILGASATSGGATGRSEPSTATVDLSALVPARTTGDANAQAALPSDVAPGTAGRLGRAAGMALPTTAGLDLGHGDAAGPAVASASDAADPFTMLSSMVGRVTESEAEPETVDMAPIKMSVVTRETHFEPVARLSPVQQIVTAVGEELVAAAETAPTNTTSQSSEPSRHSAGPLKVLHVKLEPEDLGAVVLKMRLVDKSLELEVIASRQETADLLTKDRDMLTRALRGSGYTADVVTISASTAPDAGQQTGDGRPGAQTTSGQPGAQAGGNKGSNDPAGGGDRQQARPQPMEGATHEENGAGRSGGDLYL